MNRTFLPLTMTLLLTSCLSQDPGTQCLNSFKSTLKDPDSGRVISFDAPTLTYSATNSYGARTQGKALCLRPFKGGKWVRDGDAERIAILLRSRDKLRAYNECRRAKSTGKECAGNSLTLNDPAIPIDLDKLNEESATELGF